MKDKLYHAFLGSLIADAAAMPVHWYYDVSALDRDYPDLELYTKPNNPHPDSILWRSSYQPRNKDANILHDQAQYWGKRNVQYHFYLQERTH
jgi:ADP-ribosyl-[dinitrogen reductase] hydrolase